MRGAPLSQVRERLAQISRIARDSRTSDAICRHWPNARFDHIERLAVALLNRRRPI